MRGKLISLVLLSLVGCSSPNKYTSIEVLDFPAYPIKADREQVNIKVEWVSQERLEAIVSDGFKLSGQHKAVIEKIEEQADRGFLGYTDIPTKDDPTCYIYALQPQKASDHEKIYTLGHELLHCLAGYYH